MLDAEKSREQLIAELEAARRKVRVLEAAYGAGGRTDDAFEESHEIFRALAESSPLAIYVSVGIEQRCQYLNPTFERLFGYSLEDVPAAEHWWPKAYPDEKYRARVEQEWQARVARAIETRSEIEPMEATVTCKDGSRKTISWGLVSSGSRNIAFGLDVTKRKRAEEALRKTLEELEARVAERTWELNEANGRLLREVAERRQAQEQLRQSEDKFRTIFDSISEIVLVHDPETGAILGVNQRACEAYGYSRDEFDRLDVGVLSSGLEPYDQAHAVARMRQARGDGPQHFEWQARKRDGELFWVDMSVRKARIGDADRLLVSARDITARKAAQDEILREKAFTDAVMNSVPGLLYLYDDQGRLVRWNKKHTELTGYSSEELSRMTLFDWYKDDPEEIEKIRKAVERINTDGFSHAEGHLRNKDGSRRLYYFTGVPLVLEGKRYFTGIGIDITERKRMQEFLVQTEKMMSVGGLAAGMAHEINNPLSGILQNVQVILRRLSPEGQANLRAAEKAGIGLDRLHDYLQRREILAMLAHVREAAVRAAQIVCNMLEFCRGAEPSRPCVELSALLDKTLELCATDYDLKRNYDFRKIEIVKDYDPALPPVPCTAPLIQQVVMNLLLNAAQAMSGRGADSPPPRIVLRTRRENGMARITVEDNGPGIPEDVRRRIFEPFFTTKPVGTGTGLGLSIAYFIVVNSHKGTIDVESHPGGGTVFTIRLPLVVAPDAS
ncbi:PAS domain S-box protein [Fundidesulfovibrio terrae]|uniref:PAS domain S-box protein n=1 Tax=Fundidesulfovibrio terrae TaxID=2922866 RepID=UPI001FAF3F70|nr:PAS domain S-box protein [Fundidesulfovibrio terrae]